MNSTHMTFAEAVGQLTIIILFWLIIGAGFYFVVYVPSHESREERSESVARIDKLTRQLQVANQKTADMENRMAKAPVSVASAPCN